MKIIGTAEHGYLALLTPDDLAALAGEYAFHNVRQITTALGIPQPAYGDPVLIGREIQISERWRRLLAIESKAAQLVGAAENMRALATVLDLAAAGVPKAPPKES